MLAPVPSMEFESEIASSGNPDSSKKQHALGGPDAGTRRVMALGTGQRNIAAALVIASQSFSDPKVVVMVIVVAIVGLILLVPISRALANR
jgi:BASS family bile acid:Na+ symporter